MRGLVLLLLVATVAADPLPEGAELTLLTPEAGQLLRDDLRRLEVTWSAKGVPERALVRVQYRIGKGRWWTAPGGAFIPAEQGAFRFVIPRGRQQGELAVGLTYLAPHEPKIWVIDAADGLKAIAERVRPGDTVQFTIAEVPASVQLPGGITVRGASGSGTSIVFGKRSGSGLIFAGVAGLKTPTRLEKLRFRVGPDAPPRMLDRPHGVTVRGGRAEIVECVFDAGLSTGIHASAGAHVRAIGCRFAVTGGKGALALGSGTTLEVDGGIFTDCGQGVVGQGGTTIICRNVSFQRLKYSAVRINGTFARRVVVENCRIQSAFDGISLRVLDSAVVTGNTLDVGGTAIQVEGLEPMQARGQVTMRTRAQVLVEKNTIRRATIGVRAADVANCVVRQNTMNLIDLVGVQLDCPGTVEANRMRGTKRPASYAPPQYEAAWTFGTMGVLFGIERSRAKPTIRNNDIYGITRFAIVLVGGGQATIAENRFDANVPRRIAHLGRASRSQREQARKLWSQARAKWEQQHPDERKRRR